MKLNSTLAVSLAGPQPRVLTSFRQFGSTPFTPEQFFMATTRVS